MSLPVSLRFTFFLVAAAAPGAGRAAQAQPGLPASIYEHVRSVAEPRDGSAAPMNPPALLWPVSPERGATYRVELSRDSAFPPAATLSRPAAAACFFNPHRKLGAGTWYWRYEIIGRNGVDRRGPFSFTVSDATPEYVTPSFETVLKTIPTAHPIAATCGVPLATVRRRALTDPLAGPILSLGMKYAKEPVYRGPVDDHDPDIAVAYRNRVAASKELTAYRALTEAWLLRPDPVFLAAILERTEVLLTWKTDDLQGSRTLSVMTYAYDALYEEIPVQTRRRILDKVAAQIRLGVKNWPGNKERLQLENHFWQMELAANFTAALVTLRDIPESRAMLEYTYGLFVAKFPNMGGPDGGWAEGLGYLGVNRSAVVDMAVLLKRVCGADVFRHPWYSKLPDYLFYFAPPGGAIDGFGDQRDRVGNGPVCNDFTYVAARETGEPRALWLAARSGAGNPACATWYKLMTGPSPVATPAATPALPGSLVLPGTGLAAMHTAVAEPKKDTAVYFRSSPWGAKGHMHANQNAFTLTRGGEPVFYSTGYYTSFADAFSLTSFRHSRAYNTVLVDGKGQAYGHESYGWIERAAAGTGIFYVCGEAGRAYGKTVDPQLAGMLKAGGLSEEEGGYGGAPIRLFERHLAFVPPDALVVYDILESDTPRDWTLLLHTIKKSALTPGGELRIDTGKTVATAFVTGSGKLTALLSDKFARPAMDQQGRYKSLPDQYHASFASPGKFASMRFLTLIRCGDSGSPAPVPVRQSDGSYRLGAVRVTAELDTTKPAVLAVESGTSALFVNGWPAGVLPAGIATPSRAASVLIEKGATPIVTESVGPEGRPYDPPYRGE